MPYRIDVPGNGDRTLDRLIDLGALDVDVSGEGIAALLPDNVTPQQLENALGVRNIVVSPALGRDTDSVWVLRPRPIQIGRLRIIPASMQAEPGALKLIDAPAFGTGLHPTTALCLEALEEAVQNGSPGEVLDVGTGSGVLALAALVLGVPRAAAVDTDDRALHIAAENARLNGLGERLQLGLGGPEAIRGTWPLVLANVLAAPLIAMAPALVRRVAHHGRVILSGIASALEPDVERAYRHLGMHRVTVTSRGGWVALVLQASW